MCVPLQKETYTIFPVFLRKNRKKQDILHGKQSRYNKQSRYWNRTICTQVNTISKGSAYGSRYHNIFRNNKSAQQHESWIRAMKSNKKAVWLPCTVTVLTPYGLWMIVSFVYLLHAKKALSNCFCNAKELFSYLLYAIFFWIFLSYLTVFSLPW